MKKFNAIIGYEMEKQELMRLCDVMQNEEKYRALGVEMPRAVLIHGDPGLGKTLMAKTLIEESGRKCFSCKKDRSDGAFVDKIRETFEQAINSQPSIVFLDDMDKFAQDNLREDSNKEEFVTIQSCIEDLKGKDVFVVATANDIYNIPYSLLREGRFGKRIKVETPNKEDSIKIIEHYLKNKIVASDVSAEFVASLLENRSCAFLESVINEAGIYAGFENLKVISKKNFIDAYMCLSTRHLPSKKMSDAERKMVSYHEAGHAVASILLGKKIALLSSRKHGEVGGFCSTYSHEEENHTYTEFKNEILILLAGKAGMELVYNSTDLGVESDIKQASKLTRYYIEKLVLKGFSYLYDGDPYYDKQPIKRIDIIADKVSKTLEEFYVEVVNLLKDNMNLLEGVAEELYNKEVLVWEEIDAIYKKIQA